MARNYKKEYENYQGKPEQIKRRASRNAARAAMVKAARPRRGTAWMWTMPTPIP